MPGTWDEQRPHFTMAAKVMGGMERIDDQPDEVSEDEERRLKKM